MDHNDTALMTFAKLSGLRLGVVASRLACADDEARGFHDRLLTGLDRKIAEITHIGRLERLPVDPQDANDLEEEIALAFEDFGHPIHLMDSLDIDRGTMECRVNGGEWVCVYDAETGCADYPSTEDLDEDELHGLSSIIDELVELGVDVRAYRVRYGWERDMTNANAPAPASIRI